MKYDFEFLIQYPLNNRANCKISLTFPKEKQKKKKMKKAATFTR